MASVWLPCLVQPPPRYPNRFMVRCADDRQALFNRIASVYDNVIGLDFSRDQLLVASSKQQSRSKLRYRNIEWIEGDALHLPFPDDYFDAIAMGYGLRNVVDRGLAMKEIFHFLKPGSTVSVLDFNKSTQPFTTIIQGWMLDNLVVPTAGRFGMAKEYEYLKTSIVSNRRGIGFSSAKFYEIAGGFMGNLVATR